MTAIIIFTNSLDLLYFILRYLSFISLCRFAIFLLYLAVSLLAVSMCNTFLLCLIFWAATDTYGDAESFVLVLFVGAVYSFCWGIVLRATFCHVRSWRPSLVLSLQESLFSKKILPSLPWLPVSFSIHWQDAMHFDMWCYAMNILCIYRLYLWSQAAH